MAMAQSARLDGWQLWPVALRYHRVIRWSDTVEDRGEFMVLELRSDGLSAFAEVTVKPTWNGETLRTLAATLEEIFLPALAKIDLDDRGAVATCLRGYPDNHAAKALIDNACWDLRAARAGRPLWALLGGAERVPVSFTLTRAAPAVMAREAEGVVRKHGFRTLKIKGGQGVAVDVEAVREVRHAVGRGVALYVDANWAYPAEEGARYVEALGEQGVTAVEDPWRLEPDRRFREAQARAGVPILVDFACTSPADATAFLEMGARVVSAKPARIGISACREIAARTYAQGAAVVAGLFGESDLGTLASLSFASACPSPGWPCECTFFLSLSDQLLKGPLALAGGEITLPAAAGWAHSIDRRRLEAQAVR